MSKEKHSMHGAREKNVNAVGSLEETDGAALVVSHQRNQHYLGLFSLEVVDCG
jgi:hypothetical protein